MIHESVHQRSTNEQFHNASNNDMPAQEYQNKVHSPIKLRQVTKEKRRGATIPVNAVNNRPLQFIDAQLPNVKNI